MKGEERKNNLQGSLRCDGFGDCSNPCEVGKLGQPFELQTDLNQVLGSAQGQH